MFHVIFWRPQIPPNTGNAIRLVACTGATLHLIEPLGFTLEDRQLRRAGLDYHDLARVQVHASLEDCLATLPDSRVFAFTRNATVRHTDVAYQAGDALLFGREEDGLSPEVLDDARVTEQVAFPMLAGRRSLNLSNCAAIATYEAWRQHDFAGAASAG